MSKFYAGIGARRKVPLHVLELMTALASKLELEGYILRSGNADGSDTAFQKGVVDPAKMEIFLSSDGHRQWALTEVKKCMPDDRSNFDTWSNYVKGLLARNMMQVLGREGDKPISFVLCYAPSFEYTTSKPGGTGYAIRCAINKNIPVYNMFDEDILRYLTDYLKQTNSWLSFRESMILA